MRDHSEPDAYVRFEVAGGPLRIDHAAGGCTLDEQDMGMGVGDENLVWHPPADASPHQQWLLTAGGDDTVTRPRPIVRALALEERVQLLEDKLELGQKRERRLEQQLAEVSAKLSALEQLSALSRRPAAVPLDALISVIRTRALEIEGVTSAYVRPDGQAFVLAGPEWTEALSAAGAALAIEVQERFAPSADPFIEGGFMDLGDRPIDNWLKVYP